MKLYYEARILESKELRGRNLNGMSYSLLGGCEMLVEYGEIRILQVMPYEPGDIIISSDSKLIMKGDCVCLQTE
jgi:hypothetical protein